MKKGSSRRPCFRRLGTSGGGFGDEGRPPADGIPHSEEAFGTSVTRICAKSTAAVSGPWCDVVWPDGGWGTALASISPARVQIIQYICWKKRPTRVLALRFKMPLFLKGSRSLSLQTHCKAFFGLCFLKGMPKAYPFGPRGAQKRPPLRYHLVCTVVPAALFQKEAHRQRSITRKEALRDCTTHFAWWRSAEISPTTMHRSVCDGGAAGASLAQACEYCGQARPAPSARADPEEHHVPDATADGAARRW